MVATQSVTYLNEIRKIEQKFGIEGTYSYAAEFFALEQYVVFTEETVFSVGLSILAVTSVILIISANVAVTLLVAFSVLLVDFFLVALIYYWSLTFNSILVVNLVISIGMAVDFSAHIAHKYLIVVPPASCKTDSQKRKYKAVKAVS